VARPGARQGLRYDPDMGSDALLACSSSGLAWLSGLDDDAAMALVAQQGLGEPGVRAQRTGQPAGRHAAGAGHARARLQPDLRNLHRRPQCHGGPGAPAGQAPLGTLSIAGPTVRFTPERMQALGPELLACAAQLAAASGSSPFFNKPSQGLRAAAGAKPIYAA
jgi:DNA-binding IclR family transcriptional regulator